MEAQVASQSQTGNFAVGMETTVQSGALRAFIFVGVLKSRPVSRILLSAPLEFI